MRSARAGCIRASSWNCFVDEAEGYYLNLSAPQPFVFVNWHDEDGRAVPKIVTVSYNEAARLMDAGEQVDGVPMPPNGGRGSPSSSTSTTGRSRRSGSRPPSFKGARRDEP